MADKLHGVLEDIGAEIGYTATCSLVDWFGGRTLYIPESFDDSHDIARVIGARAFARLVRMADSFDGRLICLPIDFQRELLRRDRLICALIARGAGTKEVAKVAIITERQVQNIRRRLEADGLLPLVLKDGPAPASVAALGCADCAD